MKLLQQIHDVEKNKFFIRFNYRVSMKLHAFLHEYFFKLRSCLNHFFIKKNIQNAHKKFIQSQNIYKSIN